MATQKFSTFLLLAALSLTACLGCHKQGPLESAGNRADEIVDNVREGEPPLKKKGTMEKAGESLDDAIHTDRNRR